MVGNCPKNKEQLKYLPVENRKLAQLFVSNGAYRIFRSPKTLEINI